MNISTYLHFLFFENVTFGSIVFLHCKHHCKPPIAASETWEVGVSWSII